MKYGQMDGRTCPNSRQWVGDTFGKVDQGHAGRVSGEKSTAAPSKGCSSCSLSIARGHVLASSGPLPVRPIFLPPSSVLHAPICPPSFLTATLGTMHLPEDNPHALFKSHCGPGL